MQNQMYWQLLQGDASLLTNRHYLLPTVAYCYLLLRTVASYSLGSAEESTKLELDVEHGIILPPNDSVVMSQPSDGRSIGIVLPTPGSRPGSAGGLHLQLTTYCLLFTIYYLLFTNY